MIEAGEIGLMVVEIAVGVGAGKGSESKPTERGVAVEGFEMVVGEVIGVKCQVIRREETGLKIPEDCVHPAVETVVPEIEAGVEFDPAFDGERLTDLLPVRLQVVIEDDRGECGKIVDMGHGRGIERSACIGGGHEGVILDIGVIPGFKIRDAACPESVGEGLLEVSLFDGESTIMKESEEESE